MQTSTFPFARILCPHRGASLLACLVLALGAPVQAETPYPEEPCPEEPCPEEPREPLEEYEWSQDGGLEQPSSGDRDDRREDPVRAEHGPGARIARELAERAALDGLHGWDELPGGGRFHPENPGVDLSDQIGRLSFEIGDSTVACGCKEGQITYAAQGRTTTKFNILDGEMSVKTKSATNGGYGIPGAENALDFKAPVTPTPIGIYNAIVRAVGARALKAGKKIADKNAAQLLDIDISIPLKPVTVVCAPAKKCVNGQLVDIGVVEMSRTVGERFIRKQHFEAVGPKELRRLGQKVINGCNLRDAGYQPCGSGGGGTGGGGATSGGGGATSGGGGATSGGGGSTSGGGGVKTATPPTTPASKSCDPIRTRLDRTNADLERAQADLARLEAEQKRLEALSKQKRAEWDAKLDAALKRFGELAREYEKAGKDMDTAIERMKQAFNDEARARITRRYKEAQARQAAVQKKLAKAKTELQKLSKPPAELDRITDQIGAVFGQQVDVLRTILKLIDAVKQLEGELSACEASGGR